MIHNETDPEEYCGVKQERKAEPKGKPIKAAPIKSTSLALDVVGQEMASPVPPVAVYNPPAEGEAHPKIARKAPAERLNAAEAALIAANSELQAATSHLRTCERAEADALSAMIVAMPGRTFDEVNRERLAKETVAKLARVQAGLSPTEPRKPTHGNSPVDVAAAQRPRTSPMAANSPLRSPIIRRAV